MPPVPTAISPSLSPAKLLRSRVANLLEARRRMARLVADRPLPPALRHAAPTAPQDETPTDTAGETPRLSAIDERFLAQLHDAISKNIDNSQLSIAFLCDEMGMSQSSLYRKIKGLTGMSGNVLIRKRRLRHALRLMQEEGRNVSEAAYASGFGDLAYFRQCFKDEFGMSATEYLASQLAR